MTTSQRCSLCNLALVLIARKGTKRSHENLKIMATARAHCHCAYSIGTRVNRENFLTASDNPIYAAVTNMINNGVWYGAANTEVGCGDRSRHMSIAVSCLSNSVLDRVKLCQAGTSSPNENLVSTVTATGYLDPNDSVNPPAPCEIHPPYCRRVASTPI